MILIPEPLQFLVELLLAECLFIRNIKRRELFYPRLLISLFLLAFFSLLWPAKWDGFVKVFKFLLTYGFSVIFLWRLFLMSFWDAVFIGTTAYAVQHIAFNLAVPLYLYNPFPATEGGRILHAFGMLAVYAIVYVMAFFVLGKKLKPADIRIRENRSMGLFVIVMLILVIVLNYARFLDADVSSKKINLILSAYSVVGCIFALYIQFFLLEHVTLSNRLEIAEQLLHSQKEHYSISEQTIEYINVKCHDLKYQISKIRKGISDGDTVSGLKEVEDSVMIYDSFIRTGNEALDVILTEKSLLCKNKGIQLTCMADGRALRMMRPEELYSLFGNILDNAIEGVSELEDPEKRVISLTVHNNGNMVLIHEENYYDHPIRMKEGLPQTTKQDTRYHGFGMRSIKLIIDKYDGSLSIQTEDSIFSLNILLISGKGAGAR